MTTEHKGLDHAYEQVKEFQKAFNHPVKGTPTFMEEDRAMKRSKWMIEEIDEFLEAEDVNEQADAMIDLIYFALGTLVEIGVKPQALMDIVQDANMSKLWEDGNPRYNELGKVIKPEGWQDPYNKLQAEIEKQSI
jgi:predicted HAD superfamily Cof-like phosphohydrolase